MRIVAFGMAAGLFLCFGLANGDSPREFGRAPACVELRDQFDVPQKLTFPATNVVVLTIADKQGSDQIDGWVATFKARYPGRIDVRGLADVAGVPGWWRAKVRRKFQEIRKYPVMMDWTGKVCAQFGFQAGAANVYVIARDGVIRARAAGPARDAALREIVGAIDAALQESAPDRIRLGSGADIESFP